MASGVGPSVYREYGRLESGIRKCLDAIEAYERVAADAAFAALLIAMQECECSTWGWRS